MTNADLIGILMGFPRQAEVRASLTGSGVVIKARPSASPIVVIHLPPEDETE